MRSIKSVPLGLVIGAFTLGAFCARLVNPTSTTASVVSARVSKGLIASAAEAGRPGASGVHAGRAAARQINELLGLYGIPVVLSTSAPVAQPSQHDVAVCFASERDTLIIALSAGG